MIEFILLVFLFHCALIECVNIGNWGHVSQHSSSALEETRHVSHDPRADCVKIFNRKKKKKKKDLFESKENEKKKQQKPGRDLIIGDLFSAGFRSRDLSHVMLAMRPVTLSPYFFPSFLPRLLSSLQGSLRSFEGGREGTSHWKGMVIGVETFFLIEEEEACSMRGGHVFWHVADF